MAGEGGWSTWSDEEDDDDGFGAIGGRALLDELSRDPVLNQLSRDGVLRVVSDDRDPDFGGVWPPREGAASSPDPDFGGEWLPQGSSDHPDSGGEWDPREGVRSSRDSNFNGECRSREGVRVASDHPDAGGEWVPEESLSSSRDSNFGEEWRSQEGVRAASDHPDSECGGECRPRGRLKGIDASSTETNRRKYSPPRPPRRDSNVDYGLNKRRGEMENRIYVASLPYGVYEEELDGFFAKFGRVKTCQVVRERSRYPNNNRGYWSKGFGFVTFEDAEGMEAALNAKDEQLQLRGRRIVVDKARGRSKGEPVRDDDDVDDSNVVEDPEPTQDGTLQKEDDANAATAPECPTIVDLEATASAMAISASSSPSATYPSFLHLPDTVAVKIFGFLTLREKVGIELVSKRWRRLAQLSWATLTEFLLPDHPGFYAFRTFIDDRQFIKLLNRMIIDLKTKRCNLKKLDLSRSALGYHALRAIGETCPRLEFLDLSGTKVSLNSLRSISRGCPSLRRFSLRESSDVNDKSLWYILKDCHSLENLDIRGCSRIVGNFFHLANDRLLSVNLERCSKLKDASLAKLASKCPNLTELNISNCNALTPDGMGKIADLPRLESLTARQMNFPSVLENPLLASVVRPEALIGLDLAQNRCVRLDDLDVIYSRCGRLKRLNLYCCYSLNGMSFEVLTGRLPRLEYLNLSYVEVDFGNARDHPWFDFARHSGRLKELVLVAVPNFDDGCLELCLRMYGLESLDISGNYQASGDAFANHVAGLAGPSDPEEVRERKIAPSENGAYRDLERTLWDGRGGRRLKVKIGGTEIGRTDVESFEDFDKYYELNWFDSSIYSLRQDQRMVERGYDVFDQGEDHEDDDDDDDSFGAGGDLNDFDYLDPMEEFERNWIS